MSAAVPISFFHHRLTVRDSGLRKPRESIILREDADNRFSLTVSRDKGRRNAGYPLQPQ